MSENEYDLIIIGSGPGGYHSAIRAAQYGVKVALIEKHLLGGTCSNYGCIPTKALYSSAHLMEEVEDLAGEMGVIIDGNVTPDFKQAVKRKNRVVEDLREGINALLKRWKVTLYYGFGKIAGGSFEGGYFVEVHPSKDFSDREVERLQTKYVLIATGSEPAMIPAFNIDHKRILDSNDILRPGFDHFPKTLLIIGAGVIGCEFANIFARMGAKVTMLEYLDDMLATEDRRIRRVVETKFKAMDIEVHTSQNVLSVENSGEEIIAQTVSSKIAKEEIETAEKSTYTADLCIVSIGRTKFTQGLGLDTVGIEVENGGIKVDKETLETSAKGIYAIGDVTGGMMLAHVASYEGDLAIRRIISALGIKDLHSEAPDYGTVPYTIFTSPNIGGVGISSADARKLKPRPLTGIFYYKALGKAQCMEKTEGLLQILVDPETDLILGASCVGEGASEIIAMITICMKNNVKSKDLAHTVHSHPTISEIALEAVEDVYGLAIHRAGRPKID